jgi:hypothetical protein
MSTDTDHIGGYQEPPIIYPPDCRRCTDGYGVVTVYQDSSQVMTCSNCGADMLDQVPVSSPLHGRLISVEAAEAAREARLAASGVPRPER